MYGSIIISVLILITITYYYRYTKSIESAAKKDVANNKDAFKTNKEKFNHIIVEISVSEEKIHNILKLYEINRKLSHILNSTELLQIFPEELSRIEEIKNVTIQEIPLEDETEQIKKEILRDANILHFKIKSKEKEWDLNMECSEPLLQSQFPYLMAQFKLLLDRAQMYQQLQKISITDSLTLLPNKKHFLDRLEEEFSRSTKFDLSLTFLMIDIDHFKHHNDTYGHLVGDEILRIISQIIRDNIREIDLPGRFGGEEFSVFFPETSKSQALPVAERLRTEIEKSDFRVYDEKINLTVSIGVASSPEDTKNLDRLIEKADQALYKAKKSGRNQVCTI